MGMSNAFLSRVLTLSGTPLDKTFNDTLWKVAENLTPSERVGDYTQAIMDLGATLCTRTKPRLYRMSLAYPLCSAPINWIASLSFPMPK